MWDGQDISGWIGATYNLTNERWVWADGMHYMSDAEDYSSCPKLDDNGVCPHDREDGTNLLCLVSTIVKNGQYKWVPKQCTVARNYICEVRCLEQVRESYVAY